MSSVKVNKNSKDYKCLLFLSQPLMMNIRNLASKENLGVKFKKGLWANFRLKLWFKMCPDTELFSVRIFVCSVQMQEKYGPEITLYLTLFTQFVRRCSSRCFPMNIAKFLRTAFLSNTTSN